MGKGDAGQVVVVGGSRRYAGPPLLAALAALRCAVDDVRLVVPGSTAVLGGPVLLHCHARCAGEEDLNAALAAEGWEQSVAELGRRCRAGAAGRVVTVLSPGMGGHPQPETLLAALTRTRRRLPEGCGLVVDGNLGGGAAGLERLDALRPEVVLLSCREAHALAGFHSPTELADRLGAVVVVKGPSDHIGAPGRAVVIRDGPGTAELTKSGTGDVLAGAVGALLARGLPAPAAAEAGCHLMQAAALASRTRHGPGFLAGELADDLSRLLMTPEGDAPS
ncbi:NAD(P)H-hydrate dehydratase [Streptomyces sp. NPDC021100]|uniref:NAD(P)H-hydrate dehydratase n=1 Tax=Streptomyces sp. NPDC021100 TaxID=3365114 RepID=UPI0037B4DB3F